MSKSNRQQEAQARGFLEAQIEYEAKESKQEMNEHQVPTREDQREEK